MNRINIDNLLQGSLRKEFSRSSDSSKKPLKSLYLKNEYLERDGR